MHRFPHFAAGNSVEQLTSLRIAPMVRVAAQSIHAMHGVAVPKPALDLGNAPVDCWVRNVDFRDPIRVNFQLEHVRTRKDQGIRPHTIKATLLLPKVGLPFFGPAKPIPFADR
jgi:hypothetical protein